MKLTLVKNQQGRKVQIGEYVVILKWISFGVLGLMIFGSYIYNIIRNSIASAAYSKGNGFYDPGVFAYYMDDSALKYLRLVDYFMLFFESDKGMIPRNVTSISNS